MLEDVVKKVELNKKLNKEKIDEKSIINISENKSKKINLIKKSKIKKEKITNLKKVNKKSNPVENVINKEIKPIIQNWIKNNLRVFVKKVVLEEFKAISKSAFKKKSVSK